MTAGMKVTFAHHVVELDPRVAEHNPEQLPFDTVMDTVCRPSVTLVRGSAHRTGASDLL